MLGLVNKTSNTEYHLELARGLISEVTNLKLRKSVKDKLERAILQIDQAVKINSEVNQQLGDTVKKLLDSKKVLQVSKKS